MRSISSRWSLLAIVVFLVSTVAVYGQPVGYRAIAVTGLTTVPVSGGTFNGFFQGAINNSGNVVFGSTYGSNVYGIFGDFGSGLQAIARGDGPNLPGTGGTIQNSSQFSIILNDSNHYAFSASYSPTPTTNIGIFSNLSGSLAPVMLTNPGTAVPGVAATFTGVGGATYPVLSSNSVAFHGVDSAFQSGNYRYSPADGITKMVRNNDPFPGAPPRVFTNPNGAMAINTQGVAAYLVSSQIPGAPPTSPLAHVYTSSPTQTTEIARSGTTAPGTSLPFFAFGGSNKFVSIDQLNNVGFYASYGSSGQQKGLFANYNSSLIDIARSDGPLAPGTTGNFSWTFLSNASPLVMNNGHMLFHAGTTSGVAGLWGYYNGTLSKVVFSQDIAPDSGLQIGVIQSYATDAFGNVVLTNASGSTRSLFYVDGASGVIRTLIQAGQTWDLDGVPGGPSKVVSQVYLAGHPIETASGADGWPRAFNDNGQVLVDITFTDNSFGLYVISVPEPSTILLITMPVFLCSGYWLYRRRQQRIANDLLV